MALFDVSAYKSHLKTELLGATPLVLEKTDSTNNWIARNLGKDNITSAVVIAERQTAGRGRQGRKWLARPELDLTFSLCCNVGKQMGSTSMTTLAAGVALAEAADVISRVKPTLKYPNDLLVSGKKMAGILSEFKQSGAASYVVIGVGVNVNSATHMFADDLKSIATSIYIEDGAPKSRERLLALFLNRLEPLLGELGDGKTGGVINGFRKYAQNWFGRTVTIKNGDNSATGKAIDISEKGALLVETDTGEVLEIISGETILQNGAG